MSDGSLGEDVQNFIARQSIMDDNVTNYCYLDFCHIRHVIEFEIIDNSLLQQLYDALDYVPELDTYIYRQETK